MSLSMSRVAFTPCATRQWTASQQDSCRRPWWSSALRYCQSNFLALWSLLRKVSGRPLSSKMPPWVELCDKYSRLLQYRVFSGLPCRTGRELRSPDDTQRDLWAIVLLERLILQITPRLLKLTETLQEARETQEAQQDRRKSYADKHRCTEPSYKVGDRVLVIKHILSNAAKGVSVKLAPNRSALTIKCNSNQKPALPTVPPRSVVARPMHFYARATRWHLRSRALHCTSRRKLSSAYAPWRCSAI